VTNEYWYNKIDPLKITVPEWNDLDNMHPCDFQTVMLKGCTPPDDQKEWFYSKERRRRIRRIYYAMIAEFDSMVGAYIQKLKELDLYENTMFIIISDHGDMNMEHQKHYKTSPFEASARVPMIFSWPGKQKLLLDSMNKNQKQITQLLDLFPSFLDIAQIDKSLWPNYLDGNSLFPGFNGRKSEIDDSRVILSQFHGNENAISWFMLRYQNWKYVKFGTGREEPAKLYDLSNDPLESKNLIGEADPNLIGFLEQKLNALVDPKSVSIDVAKYNKHMFKAWMNSSEIPWETRAAAKDLRWHSSWMYDPKQAVDAVNIWLNSDENILPSCRHQFVFNVSTIS
jgi:arylsulfatase A-like enzyme